MQRGDLFTPRRLPKQALSAFGEAGLDDSGNWLELKRSQLRRFLTLTSEATDLILTNSISPLPLHKTLTLLAAIEQLHDPRYCRHELLAFAKAAVYRISNLHFVRKSVYKNAKWRSLLLQRG
jgi:hypothetical protein